MLYGEGKKAFRRLQLETIREYSDQSIFAWNPQILRAGSVLEEDPSDFRGCGGIKKVEPNRLGDRHQSDTTVQTCLVEVACMHTQPAASYIHCQQCTYDQSS
ncbi:hypothetical protein EDD15DRAFT_2303980 [Pisolithus albus]|nr:hypothetical protein EDD15DRAFT_2303980 [Pisolithus albus]